MGLFDLFKKKGTEEGDIYRGETPSCPQCGESLIKKYDYSDLYCSNCNYELDGDDLFEDEELSVYEAADIWISNGKDEDYMFGFTKEELEKALK